MRGAAVISLLKVLHGTFNLILFLLFCYQARLGWGIRKNKKDNQDLPVKKIRRHRKLGPLLAILGIGGYFGGVSLVLLNWKSLFKYPLHFAGGTALMAAIISASYASRKIKGQEIHWRNRHFFFGLTILFLYLLQHFSGLKNFF